MLDWFRRAARAANEVDRRLARQDGQLPRTIADPALKRLSNAANRSGLWLLVAVTLASRKGPTRRAAFRGLAAVGGASAATNLIAKPLLPRRRPAAQLVPKHRRLADPPTSPSFPSGHAASAAAFVTAVAMESPLTGAALAPVAVAVAYSRVHTGVHWPSDVLCGTVVGAGMAWATKWWWPLPPQQPATVHHSTDQPALRSGEHLLVLVNPDSGEDDFEQLKWVKKHWPAAKIVRLDPAHDVAAKLTALVEHDDELRALGVAGGDGTVATAATVAQEHGLALAVVSSGTLNHFARDIGVTSPGTLSSAVETGNGARVDLGTVTVDDAHTRWFVNTASLGGYPDMVRFRQKWEPRWGKWAAAAGALIRVLYESTPLTVDINGSHHTVWVLFVGNGSYAPKGFVPSWRPSICDGTIDVRYVRADSRFSRLRFIVAASLGALHRSRTYVEYDTTDVEVTVRGQAVHLATDGEIGPAGKRFRFESHRDALNIYCG